jgi:alkylation response protein AidB-like acyl-CoA dehydrogenase
MQPRTASIELAFSPEQEELRRGVRRFLESTSPISRVRTLMETEQGYDPKVWAQMATELELQALAVPEAYGGAGYSFVELGVVLEEMGRALLCAPFFSPICLASPTILAAGTEEQKADLLPGIAAGTTIATLALTEEGGRWDASGVGLRAAAEGGGTYRLEGVKTFVPDGQLADMIVVAARAEGSSGPDGISLFTVAGEAPGISRTPLTTMDLTRKQARVEFAGVRAHLLGAEGAGWAALSTALDQAAACLAAEQVGGAEQCLQMAVEYAKLRVQFGKPIGSFQAIKHRCAEMLVWVEASKSAAYYAGWAAATGAVDLPAAASIAQAYCSEAYFRTAAENIQVHGGIGFTWEHDAHLYFRRAKACEVLLGDPTYHRERLAQLTLA